MSKTQTRTVLRTVGQTLLGTLVVFLTVPTGFGPVAGGWLASGNTDHQSRAVVASAVAGLLGVLPWTALVFLATRGAIEPIGYHEGVVHVGVQTALPGTFVLWQEIGLAVMFAGTMIAISIGGGILGGLWADSVWKRRSERLL